ncbi:MAG: Stp1/IreP family PP2C-type Ser/Thr phosphatase [Lachnospiraceae bacterium]|nr:Stp1/IreP family PP2C-type Ser/Thr phosphatase [Lachnospiraceae bacterium]
MKFYSITETGKVRSENQDCLFTTDQKIGPLKNLFLVADGMGGHKAGEYASECAVKTVVESVRNSDRTEPVAVIERAISDANERVYMESKADPEKYGMGTTMVAATFFDGHMYVANVGDSRLYVITENEIRQITQDHSYVGELVRRGTISESAARNHAKRHYITRAVGTESKVRTDFFDVVMDGSAHVLLCTDGLTNMVTDTVIKQIVSAKAEPYDKVKALLREANENGGRDNITIVLIEKED